MRRLHLDELEGLPVFGTLVWKPVRRTLGVTAFGINAYTAASAGDQVVEEHTEEQLGHEEVDAPAGTLVFLDDPKQTRHAVATQAGTTVLAIGGVPGRHEVSPWEHWFPALPAINAGNWDEGRRILEQALAEQDHPSTRYNLACLEARAGNADAALEQLERTSDRHRALARDDDDFASLRDDPRFLALTGQA